VRRLAPEEAALWKRVVETVKPMKRVVPVAPAAPVAAESGPKPPPVFTKPKKERAVARAQPQPQPRPMPSKEGSKSANTLDGTWDRQLSRGLVSPESSIDLHGHSLAAAYDRLDHGLEQAIAQGDRVLLLVTGKPPRAESERPHARGAIRAAVGDWLASSRHAGRIAAVRNAHPRHGGNGALYIVLRRPNMRNDRKKS